MLRFVELAKLKLKTGLLKKKNPIIYKEVGLDMKKKNGGE